LRERAPASGADRSGRGELLRRRELRRDRRGVREQGHSALDGRAQHGAGLAMSGGAMRIARAAVVVVCAAVAAGCTGPTLRGRVNGLATKVADAEKRGAIKCAPRELALAKAHLHFAAIDLDQGELAHAESHVTIAEPNANAAYDQSPPDRCTSRDFVEVPLAK